MEYEILKNLQISIDGSCQNDHLRSLGLSRVNRRIGLLIGKEYGIQIERMLHH